MRCEEVQEYLAERLAGSLSDRLSGTLQSYVRTHMRSCTECCEELEDFEEMQAVLRSIPVEPCDTNAMRARFNLLIGVRVEEAAAQPGPTRRSWHLPRPGKSVVAIIAGVLVIVLAVLVVLQAVKRTDVATTVPPAPVQTPKPVVAEVRTGAMSGQIRTASGEDLRKVRVAVVAVSNSGKPEIAVESNSDGSYRLENIPAGRYYVLASSIDSPTYYPGSPDVSGAKIVTVQAGAVLEGIDFSRVAAASNPPPPAPAGESGGELPSESSLVAVDVTIRHESGERLPFKPDASIVFTATNGDFQIAASHFVGNLFRVNLPADKSYAVAVSGTAAGYTIQSIVDGSKTDLMHGGLFKANPGKPARARIFVTLSSN